ncbi:hypothetical protein ACHAXH_003320 [Discostella pseudostelligera]
MPTKSSRRYYYLLWLSTLLLIISPQFLRVPHCHAYDPKRSSSSSSTLDRRRSRIHSSSRRHHAHNLREYEPTHNPVIRIFYNYNANRGGLLTSIRRGGGGDSGGAGAPTTSISQSRRRNLVVLLVATSFFNDVLQLTMLLPIIHTLVSSPPPLGVTTKKELALGLFFASKDIFQMVFAPIAGILTTKTSANLMLILSTIGLGLATLVFAEATTFHQLLIARGAQGAASAAVMCGGMSLIAETHTQDIRGRAVGFAQSGYALGLLCGPLIGGLLFQHFGRVKTFRYAGAMVLANAVAMVMLMGVAPPERIQPQNETGQHHQRATTQNETLAASSKRLLTNHDILVVTASTLIIHAVMGVIKPVSQVVLDTEFGLPMVRRSFIISIATVAYFIAAPTSGWLSDRTSRSNLVALSLVLMSGSSLFFALRHHLGIGAFYICVTLLGVALGVHKSSSQSLLADLVDRHSLREYSMVYALSDVADSLGLILGPIVGLWLSQVFASHNVGVLTVGALCFALVPIVLRIQ